MTPTEEVRVQWSEGHVQELINPTDKRIFAVAAALNDTEKWLLSQLTRIDTWFLNNIIAMVTTLHQLDGRV